MVVAMMRVRKVRMRVPQRVMPVSVRMACTWLNWGFVPVIVVGIAIVHMLVLMLESFV